MKYCLNCNQPVLLSNRFCSNCGQKTKISRLNFWTLIRDFFSNLFNVEAKIWQTLLHIWIPARLTTAFVAGRRNAYYNPLRIFIIVLFAFFTLMVFNISNKLNDVDEFTESAKKQVWEQEMMMHFDSIVPKSFDRSETATFKMQLFHIYSESHIEGDLSNLDSLFENIQELNPASVNELNEIIKEDSTQNQKQIPVLIDSFIKLQNVKEAEQDSFSNEPFNFNFSVNKDDEVYVDDDDNQLKDFFRLSEEQLYKKHSADNRFHKLVLSQLQKMLKNLSASIKFVIGNGTWAMIALILLMALVFKGMYFRHGIPYAEHFIFHVYGHTRILILAVFGFLTNKFAEDYSGAWMPLCVFIGLVYLFISMKRYYKQGFLKTFFKFLVALLAYVVLIIVCGALILGVSFLVF